MSKRFSFVFAIVATVAICLLGGIFAAGFGVRRALTESSTAQAIEENRMMAAQIARLVSKDNRDGSSDPSKRELEKLQRMVEGFKLANHGFVCVTHSKTGQLLCHPSLKNNANLLDSRPGALPMVNGSGNASILAQVESEREAAGLVETPGGTHVIAACRLGGFNANVMAHQKMAAIEADSRIKASPIYRIGLPIAALIVALCGLGSSALMSRYDTELEYANASLESVLDQRTAALTKTRNAIIFGLAKLAENRDTDTGEHLDRIREYSTLLSRKLQQIGHDINDQFVNDIGLASALHDIGKVGIPDAVLLKPGRLNPAEREVIEQHPVIGCKCLLSIEKHLGEDCFLEMATEICLTHHEKWDGSGYPLKLVGDNIPLSARIVAVADVYDALTSKRPYKDAMTHQKAHQIIMDGSGTHFDPEVAAAFDALYEDFKSVRSECSAEQTVFRSVLGSVDTTATLEAMSLNQFSNV